MYERLKRLYKSVKLDKDGLANAVVKGWITAEQYEAITGEEYESEA